MCILLFSSPETQPIPKGLTAGKDKSVTVTFHVLLPKHIWEWNAKSRMFIRFGDWQLGNWKYDCGPFNERCVKFIDVHTCVFIPHYFCCRKLSEDLSEMTGTFPIAAELLKNNRTIAYKYIVYSPKTDSDKDPFEYLHDFRTVFDRGLVLSPERFSNFVGGVLEVCFSFMT